MGELQIDQGCINMSEESNELFYEIHRIIKDTANSIISDTFVSNQRDQLVDFDDEETKILQSISLDDDQIRVLKKAFVEMGDSVVFRILCIIDGVSYSPVNIPDLALIDRVSGMPISQGLLHEEFIEISPDE